MGRSSTFCAFFMLAYWRWTCSVCYSRLRADTGSGRIEGEVTMLIILGHSGFDL